MTSSAPTTSSPASPRAAPGPGAVRAAAAVARGAARGVLAAGRETVAVLRPGTDPGFIPLRGRLARLLPYVLGLYGLIVAISASGADLNDRAGVPGGVWFLLLLPAVAGLALAAVRPLDGWRAVTGWALVLPFLPAPVDVAPLAESWGWWLWIPALLLAGLGLPARRLLVVGVFSLAVLIVNLTAGPTVSPGGGGLEPLGLLWVVIPLVVGASVGGRARARGALHTERLLLAEAQAERGALAERARIAREMHDVIGHHMSLMVVRAETAPYRLGELPEQAEREFAEVAAAAREALAELRELLGVLRSDDGRSRAPQPGLPDLDRLLGDAAATGTPISWSVVADRAAIPEPLGLSAYRIVQQAVANAAQHAPGGAIRVHVSMAAEPARPVPESRSVEAREALLIEVDNEPGTAEGRPGAGTGLLGMRERAALHGGTVEAGPRPDGGFRVRAALPLHRPGSESEDRGPENGSGRNRGGPGPRAELPAPVALPHIPESSA